jgi:hypothetical protein
MRTARPSKYSTVIAEIEDESVTDVVSSNDMVAVKNNGETAKPKPPKRPKPPQPKPKPPKKKSK